MPLESTSDATKGCHWELVTSKECSQMDACAVQTGMCACAERSLSLSAILAETGPLSKPRTCYILARLVTKLQWSSCPAPNSCVCAHAQLAMCAGNPHSEFSLTESSPHPHLVIFLKEV